MDNQNVIVAVRVRPVNERYDPRCLLTMQGIRRLKKKKILLKISNLTLQIKK